MRPLTGAWSLPRRWPRAIDAAVVVLLIFPLGVPGPVADWRAGVPAEVASILLVFLQAVPLYWRRHRPLLALTLVVAALSARMLAGLHMSSAEPEVAMVVAMYSVSVYAPPRLRLATAGLSVASIVVGVGQRLALGADAGPYFLTLAALSLAAWVAGDYVRNRRRYMAELESRAAELEWEAAEAKRKAAEEERLRIARELHDLVSHNVSLMAIQAGAARIAGRDGPDALRSIETTARDTLAELSRLLGVLRKGPDGADRHPQPGLGELEALLATARQAGLEVDLKVTGERRPLPAVLDLSAYRILQEAVTNTLKHASASRLEVRIDYGADVLELAVTDNGRGTSSRDVRASSGHGLIGMKERVELFGGELTTGSTSLGGFTIHARLPLG